MMAGSTVANPSTLGLFGFALTTALLQGAVTSITEPTTTEFLVYGFGMFYGGLCQLLAGMWEFRRKNAFAASAFASYGGFWMSFSLIGILTSAGIFEPSHNGSKMMLSLWGIVTFCFFVASLSINIALQALFLLLSIVFFLLAGGVANAYSHKAAGWIGLVVSAIAFYTGAADMINERFKKTLLPLGVVDWSPYLVPPFQRALGYLPFLGRMYLRAVEHEDSLAGYGAAYTLAPPAPAPGPAPSLHTKGSVDSLQSSLPANTAGEFKLTSTAV